jgi:hypothetical protein
MWGFRERTDEHGLIGSRDSVGSSLEDIKYVVERDAVDIVQVNALCPLLT